MCAPGFVPAGGSTPPAIETIGIESGAIGSDRKAKTSNGGGHGGSGGDKDKDGNGNGTGGIGTGGVGPGGAGGTGGTGGAGGTGAVLDCVLPADGEFAEWPNPVSQANSDAWLAVHHQEIAVLRPRVLALNFSNVSDPAAVAALVDTIFGSFAEASRMQGFANPGAPAQLQYELARPIVDLRDGVEGRPPAPPGFPFSNSTLLPRNPAIASVDYAVFFSEAFAPNLGFPDPDAPGGFLDLCTLVNRGLIHELWLLAFPPQVEADAFLFEVLETKPIYTPTGNQIPATIDPCAGNGCFAADVPFCGRSLKIGFVDVTRGPGCYLHSIGHGVESFSVRGTIPEAQRWFAPFAGFDLDTRFELPFSSFYSLGCPTEPDLPCLSYPAPTTLSIDAPIGSFEVTPYEAACGNVHFPPNGRVNFDYLNFTDPVQSSCVDFGRGDATAPVTASNWNDLEPLAPDCGGGFLLWWYQNMPSHQSGQVFTDGTPMKSIWPFRFY